MAKHDWIAAVTEPAAEYVARTELERLGLHPYMPQFKKVWHPTGATEPMVRSCPLFPRYLLIPLREARVREMHYARGLRRPKPLLADADGKPWLASEEEIASVIAIEERGGFDEILGIGDLVKLKKTGVMAGMEMFLAKSSARTAELFLPLFGGCRGTTVPKNLLRA